MIPAPWTIWALPSVGLQFSLSSGLLFPGWEVLASTLYLFFSVTLSAEDKAVLKRWPKEAENNSALQRMS